jgi:hypothetical protein
VGAAGLCPKLLLAAFPLRLPALVVAAANHGVEVLFDRLASSNYVHQPAPLSSALVY